MVEKRERLRFLMPPKPGRPQSDASTIAVLTVLSSQRKTLRWSGGAASPYPPSAPANLLSLSCRFNVELWWLLILRKAKCHSALLFVRAAPLGWCGVQECSCKVTKCDLRDGTRSAHQISSIRLYRARHPDALERPEKRTLYRLTSR